jgi:hypothetical protein
MCLSKKKLYTRQKEPSSVTFLLHNKYDNGEARLYCILFFMCTGTSGYQEQAHDHMLPLCDISPSLFLCNKKWSCVSSLLLLFSCLRAEIN